MGSLLKECLLEYEGTMSEEVSYTVQKCTWEDVIVEWERANDAKAALESHEGVRGWIRKSRRRLFDFADVLAPGIAAIPEDLCILHAGLAIVLSVRPSFTSNSP